MSEQPNIPPMMQKLVKVIAQAQLLAEELGMDRNVTANLALAKMNATPTIDVSDEEIGKASRQYTYDQGQVPTAVAFQTGARWVREMQRMAAVMKANHETI